LPETLALRGGGSSKRGQGVTKPQVEFLASKPRRAVSNNAQKVQGKGEGEEGGRKVQRDWKQVSAVTIDRAEGKNTV